MGSKAAATPTNTTQTVNSNTIPDFMRPYFNTMMSASQNQVYQTDASGQVTGMKPYQPYSTNGADYVAPLSGLQNQAINSAGALQVPGQFQQGMDMVGGAGAQGMGAGAGAMGLGMQSAGAGAQYNQMATDPNSIQGYMSPYMQNVVDYQTQQANRQYDITGQQQQMDATRSGAFGGSREAIMGAENERNRNQAITGIQATGAQNAFQNAQQAQQFGAGLNLQGLNQGIQGMQTGIAGAQQGINAGLGLGTLGAGQLGAQRDIIGTQAQQGALQQGQQQQAIDAAVQNQQQAQAYPMQQIDFLSNLMRGNPTNNNSMVTNSTVQPSMASQMFGGIGALGSLYGAYKKKRGGIVGYSVGGAIESDLSQMSPEQLQEVIQSTTSDIERQLAKKLLAEKTMAGGGIVAFADKGEVKKPVNTKLTEEEAKAIYLDKKPKEQEMADAQAQPAGIDAATPQAGPGIQQGNPQLATYQPGAEDNWAVQGASQGIPQAAGSPFDPMIAKAQAEKDNYQATPTEPDALLQQRRAEIMGQRANTADESKRQFNLRMADFFAHWGSTPGPVISAGLKALTETMPGMLEDKDKQEKLSRELSDAQFQIEWADHEEQKGNTEKARAIKEKLSTHLEHLQELKAAADTKFAEEAMKQGQQNLRTSETNATDYAKAQLTSDPNKDKSMTDNQRFDSVKDAEDAARKDFMMDADFLDLPGEEQRKMIKEEGRKRWDEWRTRGTSQASSAAPDISKYVEKYKLSPADARSYMDWEASQRGG